MRNDLSLTPKDTRKTLSKSHKILPQWIIINVVFLTFIAFLALMIFATFKFEQKVYPELKVLNRILLGLVTLYNIFKFCTILLSNIYLCKLDQATLKKQNILPYVAKLNLFTTMALTVDINKTWVKHRTKQLNIQADDIDMIRANMKNVLVNLINTLVFLFAILSLFYMLSNVLYKAIYTSYIILILMGFLLIELFVVIMLMSYLYSKRSKNNRFLNYMIIYGGKYFINLLWIVNESYCLVPSEDVDLWNKKE